MLEPDESQEIEQEYDPEEELWEFKKELEARFPEHEFWVNEEDLNHGEYKIDARKRTPYLISIDINTDKGQWEIFQEVEGIGKGQHRQNLPDLESAIEATTTMMQEILGGQKQQEKAGETH